MTQLWACPNCQTVSAGTTSPDICEACGDMWGEWDHLGRAGR